MKFKISTPPPNDPSLRIYENSRVPLPTPGVDPDQTPQSAASDQSLHCLLTKQFIKLNKMKNNTQQPLKSKWTGPCDMSRKFHSA